MVDSLALLAGKVDRLVLKRNLGCESLEVAFGHELSFMSCSSLGRELSLLLRFGYNGMLATVLVVG